MDYYYNREEIKGVSVEVGEKLEAVLFDGSLNKCEVIKPLKNSAIVKLLNREIEVNHTLVKYTVINYRNLLRDGERLFNTKNKTFTPYMEVI